MLHLMPIRVLPSELVNQIAAGEVVERPASVVKELVENSIDAGARTIDVLVENGGRKLIEVRDDGAGMPAADARIALRRHATSKIASFDDLLSVSTLGFRGEALPSIASVSRFRLVTWDGLDAHAVEVFLDPRGEIQERPAARDRGTSVVVGELFENVPARRKFLKSADAEYRSIVTVVSSYALINESIAFRLEHNGRAVLDLPRASSRRERVVQILGREAAGALSEIDTTIGNCAASGYVTRGLRFGTRRNQYFFVNNRLVKDRVLMHAATRAADAYDFDGHPAIVLFVTIDPHQVDVNVHPSKTEVRFRDSGQVHVVVEQGIKRALGGAEDGARLIASTVQDAGAQSKDDFVIHGAPAVGPRPLFDPYRMPDRPLAHEVTPLFQSAAVVQPPVEEPAGWEIPDASRLGALAGRVIGQYRLSYILVDTPDGLRLVDQHVAHERVLYDRFDRAARGGAEHQKLLTPILYECGAAEGAALESHFEELQNVGFEIERFSGNTFAISAVPSVLGRDTVPGFLRKLVDSSMEEKGSHLVKVREKVIASLACQAAIKVHRPLNGEEMSSLVAELLASSNPYACPHGRPIIVDIRHLDIEKHFHRK